MKFLFTVTLFLVLPFSLSGLEKKRILIIGDTIYNEPSRKVASLLKDRAEVVYGKNGSWSSSMALQNYKNLLGDKKWDLIYFNFGLNDIMHRDPATKQIRAMHKDIGGVKVSTPKQYENNLRELVKKFKASGAKVIWASTTPIIGNNGILYAGDEIIYNKIAAKVMADNKVPVIDMHKYGYESHQKTRHAKTYNFKGGLPLHPPVLKVIVEELKLAKPISGPVQVYIMAGGPTITGQGLVHDTKKPRAGRSGTLDDLVLNKKTAAQYKHLGDAKSWAFREDVWVKWENKIEGRLSVGYGERGNMIGPEFGFGHVMGAQLKQQLMIYKPYLNNPSLGNFFTKNGKYQTMMSQMKLSLSNLAYSFPDYTSKTGLEIGGLILSFGRNEKDAKSFSTNLTKLIMDMRKDLKLPQLPVIILGNGLAGSKYAEIVKVQQSIAEKLPNVSFLDSRRFRPDQTKSPDKSPDRWYGNAESFYKMGEALANEMKRVVK